MNTTLETLSQSLADIIANTSRSVVSVRGKRSAGTGIHWEKGLIVTSCEALSTEDSLKIGLPNGQTADTELLGADPTTDIALLSLPETIDLPTAVLGNPQALALGQLVSTVGYQISRGRKSAQFASLGMVSQTGPAWRSQRGGQIDRYIVVDLNLYRGSAGCPLINADGQVVGFNTFGPRRKVLTIPATNVTAIARQLQQRGKISQGYLGLGMQAISLPKNVQQQHDLTQAVGILIISVEPDSAADTAGLVLGDVMLAFDGETLEDLKQVQAFLGPQSVGKTLHIQLLRGGELRSISVVVGER
ncbi:S1C family serine protease [cf. Phormidesmis sp. LEGE 11477]|uniref:S1C family serine protease n=1 Tax=cf. Phormidesmis sp. LEGE 11477 TaxID=1828680 RepID=UPI00187E56EC|nr:trypsin-like peptidase domain-containing protein [cf. Phormidesmis sp. LEGE 11477]MBE9064597.1 trypsin-like peptidase domain-containing protein [cf. Phormidesmis sp. LEGE 11477]